MHAKDNIGGFGVWNFPPAGTGEVKFAPIFAALDAVGFDGPVSSEIEFQGEPWPPLAEVDAAAKTAFDYLRGFVPKAPVAGSGRRAAGGGQRRIEPKSPSNGRGQGCRLGTIETWLSGSVPWIS